MEDDLVEGGVFGGTSPVVLKLILFLLPRVAPEHTGEFGEVGIKLSVQRVGGESELQLRMLLYVLRFVIEAGTRDITASAVPGIRHRLTTTPYSESK